VAQRILFKVKVIPSSSQQLVTPTGEDSFTVRVKSPPSGGKANRECLELLSAFLKVKEKDLRILRGGHLPNKIIEWIVER
jgi:uncharacterized protein (TIGR00251 family)